MNKRNFFRRTLLTLLTVSILLFSVAHAEIKTYEGVGDYLMTDETVDFAKNQAELVAQRNILEQICVYVKEIAIMIDNELDNDEIVTVSAGILRIVDTKFSMMTDEAGINVKSFVTAQIDTDELKKLLEQEVKRKI